MRIGFVGLGTMGAGMAANVIRAGFSVTVHNRTRAREQPLAEMGAARAPDPASAARGADAVVVVVSDTPDVEEVLFGPRGVAEGTAPGSVVVDMSTISPDATRRFGERLAARGVGLVDAPVSGGSEGAASGSLTVMCGGSESDIQRVMPLLESMGSKITHVGPPGAGQETKAVNQVIVGGMYLAVAEGIALGRSLGLDMARALEAIASGACRSWVLEQRSDNMLRDSYPLGFRLSLHRKDLGIALEAAAASGVTLPLSELVARIEDELVDQGLGDQDLSAVAQAVRPVT